MNRHLWTAACVLMTLTAPLAAIETRETERRTFELPAVDGHRFLLVDNVTGSVTVRAVSGDRIELEVAKRFEAKSGAELERAKRETRLTIEQEPGRLALVQDGEFRCDRSPHRFLCEKSSEDLGYEVVFDWVLTVPRDLDLEVRNVNQGAVSIADVRGRVEAANVNGPMKLSGLAGAATVSTVNGDLEASFAALPAGDLRFASVNGKLDLAFPAGFGAELSAHTLNGEVLTDFPFQTLAPRPAAARGERGRYRLSGSSVRIGGGGPRLECETVNGDILIRARD
jgi:hypothetical protein